MSEVEAESPQAAQEAPAREGLSDEVRHRREAALLQVRKFGDPVLKSRASEVREFDGRLRAEADRMVAIMHDALGVERAVDGG